MKTLLYWGWSSLAGLILFSILAHGEMKTFNESNGTNANVLMVGLTLVQAAAAKGAVCLDGSVPGYHLCRGYGSGANNWIIQLQGGAWCDSIQNCQSRKGSGYGSSTLMEKELAFLGLLNNKAAENPDFYNWNKVKVRYCDGASFDGDSENKAAQLQFRGKRIFLAVMEDLMEKGMRQAKQVHIHIYFI
ncbi:hypothetical protein AXX17_AT1G09480 [Arabidopsis thaliana]|uniref:Pectin acetylesterase n=1 Tax=Arabidopsis thaliana TaxID=3702 RepID=A0A178WN18_ARATH|nr:hypothetical protein AXX17_AT1G09480 [Arabidopsis thaliana]